MVKGLETESLSLCVRSEIRLESVGVDDGDVSLDGVQRRSRLGQVLRYVSTATGEDLVDGWYTVLRSLDLDVVDGLQTSRVSGGL